MREERKVVVKKIEKDYIYTQNLIEVLAKKYNIYNIENKTTKS